MSAVACNTAATSVWRSVGQKRPRHSSTPERPRLPAVISPLCSAAAIPQTSISAVDSPLQRKSKPRTTTLLHSGVSYNASVTAAGQHAGCSISTASINSGTDSRPGPKCLTVEPSCSSEPEDTVLHEWPSALTSQPISPGPPLPVDSAFPMAQAGFPLLYSLAYYAPTLSQQSIPFSSADATMLAHAQAGYAAMCFLPAGPSSFPCPPHPAMTTYPTTSISSEPTPCLDSSDDAQTCALRKLHSCKPHPAHDDILSCWNEDCSVTGFAANTEQKWTACWEHGDCTEFVNPWAEGGDPMDTTDLPDAWEEEGTAPSFTNTKNDPIEEDEAPLLPAITPMDMAWSSPWDTVFSVPTSAPALLSSPFRSFSETSAPCAADQTNTTNILSTNQTQTDPLPRTQSGEEPKTQIAQDEELGVHNSKVHQAGTDGGKEDAPCNSHESLRSEVSEPSHIEESWPTPHSSEAAASHPSETSQCTNGGSWQKLNIQVPRAAEASESDLGSPLTDSRDSPFSSPLSMHSERAANIWNSNAIHGVTTSQAGWLMPEGSVCQHAGCNQKAVPSRDGQCLFCIAHIRPHIQKLRRLALEAVCGHEGCGQRALPNVDGDRLYCGTHAEEYGVQLQEGALSSKCQQPGCKEIVLPSNRGPRLYCKVHMRGRKAAPRKQPCQHPGCSKGAQASADGPCMYCVSHMRMHGLQPYKKQKCQHPVCTKLARRGTDGQSKYCACHMKLHGVEPLFKH